MKNQYAFFLLLISNLLFSQNEQLSLNYFAKELLPNIKNCKVYFDGKVILKNDYEQTTIKGIVRNYYYCRHDESSKNNNDFNVKNRNLNELQNFATFEKSKTSILTIPRNIKFKKEIKYKKRIAGRFLVKLNKIFTPKYILEVTPSIEIETNCYITVIHINKIDSSEGKIYYIVTKNKNIIDWCEGGWEL